MKVSVVLSCGGELHGDPCRQAIPSGALPADAGHTLDLAPALKVAGAAGWRWRAATDGDALLLRCPGCYRREIEAPRPQITERDRLHAARGYVCACPPDVALADCARCTAVADRLLAQLARDFGVASRDHARRPLPAADACTLPCCRPDYFDQAGRGRRLR